MSKLTELVNATLVAQDEVVKAREAYDRNQIALDMRMAEVVAAREARDLSRNVLKKAEDTLSACIFALCEAGIEANKV